MDATQREMDDLVKIVENKIVRSPEKVGRIIQSIVNTKRCSFIDAVLIFAERNGLEVETAAKLIPAEVKRKIESEARAVHMLKPIPKEDSEDSNSLESLFTQ